MRVLVVEDDRMIGEAMSLALRDAAFAVDWVRDGASALDALETQHYGAVLLDLGLPEIDGVSVIRTLRRGGDKVPVLAVTARDAVSDRIEGLDAGADDYIVKPFDMAELLARIRAVSRRKDGDASPVLSNGRIHLDPASHEARVEGAEAIRLSAREFALLRALLVRPGTILSRSELEERIYGWGEEVESNAVDFLIHGLRRKLGQDAIRNIRGAGWLVDRAP
ncbi:MAG: response regulator transcription factor [Sphingomonadales bacterium]|nr:response regulator transcription factor [Sphingomonadales bacterium]